MEVDEIEVWNFYCRNARLFVQEYGLMEGRINRLGRRGLDRELFEDRLSLCHEKMVEIRMRDAREDQEAEAKRKPGELTLTGTENG